MMKTALLLSMLTLAAALPAAAVAQEDAASFPSKPIRIIVGFTPGGAPDITARAIANKLTERWKQQVLVENRPGAGSSIAAAQVAAATPDGYTLLSATTAHSVAAAIYTKLPYDTLRDFAGVLVTSDAPTWILASPASGVKSVADLITLAKTKPQKINYASAGVGSMMHFGAEMFLSAAGVQAVHIPFKGVPEALTECVTGRVDFVAAPIGAAVNLVRDNKLAPLAVTGRDRFARYPNLPTLAESGMPGFHLSTWTGLIAPAKTPPAILAKLANEIQSVLTLPDVRQTWSAIGVETVPVTLGQMDKWVADEVARFTQAARAAGIKGE